MLYLDHFIWQNFMTNFWNSISAIVRASMKREIKHINFFPFLSYSNKVKLPISDLEDFWLFYFSWARKRVILTHGTGQNRKVIFSPISYNQVVTSIRLFRILVSSKRTKNPNHTICSHINADRSWDAWPSKIKKRVFRS